MASRHLGNERWQSHGTEPLRPLLLTPGDNMTHPRIRSDRHAGVVVPRKALLGTVAAVLIALLEPRLSVAEDTPDIVKQSQNPVASLISVPVQNNLEFGVGPKGEQADVLNLEPVIPLHLTADWNLITRTIVPFLYEPYLGPGVGNTGGLGDINFSMYLSPAKTGTLIWGVGPSVTFPTASEHLLGQGKYSAGLSGAALSIRGPWVLGVLLTDVSSVGGEVNRKNVNQMLIQPFMDLNFSHGWYLASSPMITADWKAQSANRWTVPIGGGGGRLFLIGRQAINASLHAYGNVVQGHEAGTWTLRAEIQLLFPK